MTFAMRNRRVSGTVYRFYLALIGVAVLAAVGVLAFTSSMSGSTAQASRAALPVPWATNANQKRATGTPASSSASRHEAATPAPATGAQAVIAAPSTPPVGTSPAAAAVTPAGVTPAAATPAAATPAAGTPAAVPAVGTSPAASTVTPAAATPTAAATPAPATPAAVPAVSTSPAAAVPAPAVAPAVSTTNVPVAAGSGPGCSAGVTDGNTWIKYTVRPGDNLSTIAACFDLNGYEALYQDNINVIGNNPNLIFPGEVITIVNGVMTVDPPS
jgi:hypothetical protein